MKVLVTGSTGFIGSHVVESLLQASHRVVAFCRSPQLAQQMFGDRVEIVAGDMLQNGKFQAVKGCDALIHLAGYAKNWSRDPLQYQKINVTATRSLLETAFGNGVQKAVVTSTALTIPPSTNSVSCDERCPALLQFHNRYQQSKCEMETMINTFTERGFPIVIVNPTRVFGPGLLSEANSVTKMIKQYLSGTWRLILGSGNARGNYAFVSDVADGHLRALEKGRRGERYILGGSNLSFNEFFAILASVSGKRRKMLHVPNPFAHWLGHALEFLGNHLGIHPLITPDWVETFLLDCEVSSAKAIRELDYRVTPFEEALKKTILWLQNYTSKEFQHESLLAQKMRWAATSEHF